MEKLKKYVDGDIVLHGTVVHNQKNMKEGWSYVYKNGIETCVGRFFKITAAYIMIDGDLKKRHTICHNNKIYRTGSTIVVDATDLCSLYSDPIKKVCNFDASKFMERISSRNVSKKTYPKKAKYSGYVQKRLDGCVVNGIYMPELYSIYDEIEKRRAIVADDEVFNNMLLFTIFVLRSSI